MTTKPIIGRRYQVLRRLGRGAFGEVFLAKDVLVHDRLVALKTRRIDPQSTRDARGTLAREFRLLTRVRHPNLAHVYDLGLSREAGAGLSQIYFTRQYVEGVDLVQALTQSAGDDIMRAAVVLCHALATIHDHGIIHGDLSAENVLGPVGAPEKLTIIDFGLAVTLGPSDSSQISGLRGTLAYVAPEVLRGAPLSPRADLYALGAVLHHAIAGEPPFGGSPAAVIQQHLDVLPPALDQARPDLPEGLIAVVRRLLAKDPSHRYASAWDALRDLEGTLEPILRPSAEAPLLGREVELAALERFLRPEAKVRVVGIVGDDNSGRSRFLEALRWRIELSGRAEVIELSGADDEIEPTSSLRVLLEHALLFADEIALDDELRAWLSGDRADETDRFLHRLVERLAAIFAVSSTIVLVDDIHRAAAPLQEALLQLLRVSSEQERFAPLVIAGRAGPRLERLLKAVDAVERVSLGELDEVDAGKLVGALAGEARPNLARRIRAHAGALPGAIEEVARTVLERDGREAAVELPLPTELDDAVRERIERLGPRERVVLDLAAVTDGSLGWEDIARSPRGMQRDTFLEVARHLCSLGLLLEVEGERFEFPRSALREAVYAACPVRVRRKLHKSEFQRLTSRFANVEQLTGRELIAAAKHGLRARPRGREADDVVDLVFRAARYLRQRGAPDAAIQLLQPSLSIAPSERRFALRLTLADALATTGRFHEAVELLESTAEDGQGTARGEALVRAGRILERLGDYDGAADRLERALENELDPDVKADGLVAVARVQLSRELSQEAHDAAQRASELATSAQTRARAAAVAGVAQSQLGDRAAAIAMLERARALAQGSGEHLIEAGILADLAHVQQQAGDLEAAAQLYGAAADSAEKAGDFGSLPRHLLRLGAVHVARGELTSAIELYRRAARTAHRRGNRSVVVASLVRLADLWADIGAVEEGRRTALEAMMLAKRLEHPQSEARALTAMARCSAMQSPAAGVGDAEKAAELYDETGNAEEGVRARLIAAELMLWAGEPRRAGRVAERAFAASQKLDDADLIGWARLLLTEIRIARGELNGCRQVLDELAGQEGGAGELGELGWRVLAALGELAAKRGQMGRARRLDGAAREMLEAQTGRVPPEYRDTFSRHPARRSLLRRSQPESTVSRLSEERVYRLMEVNRAVLAERVPKRLLSLALDTAIELCGAERGFLITLGKRGAVKVEVARNLEREVIRSARLKVSRSIAEEVARTGEPLLTVNAREDSRFAEYASVRELRLRSVMCVPIRGREQTLGTLYLDNRFESARFDEADLKLLLAFADVVAVALENARLIEENTQATRELTEAKAKLEVASDQQARQLKTALRELEATREALGFKYDYSQIIGKSKGMMRVFQVLDRIIDTQVPVLIHGESGTGKELIARAIHYNGPRKTGPFVSVNCGAIPETLLESELFGHVRGAFTGATADREGLLPAADRGTLFLDEIGDMSLAMQTKLLRALQEGDVRPVGATEDRHVDVRVVAASHRDLSDEVAAGRFREDLYYRVNVVRIDLPPLRERREDVPILAEHLLERCVGEIGGTRKRLTPEAIELLLSHDWPGNVRELENLLKNGAVLSTGPEITAGDIPLKPRAARTCFESDTLNLAEIERETILRALESSGGNKKKAAELLGIARLTLYRKLKSYDSSESPS